MNNTYINIEGITTTVYSIHGEQTPDMSYLIIIKDEYGNTAEIQVNYNKITEVRNGKSNCSINK